MMGDGVPQIKNLNCVNPKVFDESAHRHPLVKSPQSVNPDDAQKIIQYPMKTRGPSHLVDDKPKLTTEMEKECRALTQLIDNLKKGESAKDNKELRKHVATVDYIKTNFDKVPNDVKDKYRNARDSIVEFFVSEAASRGYPKKIARSFIKLKLSKDPKKGFEGLYYLLKRGLDS